MASSLGSVDRSIRLTRSPNRPKPQDLTQLLRSLLHLGFPPNVDRFALGTRDLVPQHSGMFEFNTVNPEYLERTMGALPDGFNVIFPRIDQALIIEGS